MNPATATPLIDGAPFLERYHKLVARGELTGPSDLAHRLGWVRPNGHADVHRLIRVLGLERESQPTHLELADAELICEALMCDPVDLGF